MAQASRPSMQSSIAQAAVAMRPRHRGETIRRFLQRRIAVVGLGMALIVSLMALFAPVLTPYDPTVSDFPSKLQSPGTSHFMGTDSQGRDLFSRLAYGARISLEVGIIASGLAVVIGAVLALVITYRGGIADNILVMFIDMMLAFPLFLLALTLMAILGPGLQNVVIAVVVSSIPRYARVMRGEVLAIKERPFVEAERAIGAKPMRVMFVHLLPNTMMPLFILFTLQVPGIILLEASLSFLGAGVPPSIPTWGNMINDGRNYLQTGWWMSLFPSVGIIITVMGFNLLGDGLRDAFDPRLRGQR